MSTLRLLPLATMLAISGCATELTASAQRVQIIPADQKVRCESLGVVSTDQRTGPNKPGNAMNRALNAAAERGGNGLYVVSSNVDWAEGASVVAEALKCPN